MDVIFVLILLSLGCVKGQFFEDRRCRCVCPIPASILNTTNTRQIYTGNVPPNLCHCEGVVFPLLKEELEGKVHIFCPRCECIYQTRNTTLIMAIVFMILSGITMTVLYLVSFTWLKCLMRGQHVRPDDRDYIREYRGEFVRQRELERQRERQRERNRHQRQLNSNSDSDEAGELLLEDRD